MYLNLLPWPFVPKLLPTTRRHPLFVSISLLLQSHFLHILMFPTWATWSFHLVLGSLMGIIPFGRLSLSLFFVSTFSLSMCLAHLKSTLPLITLTMSGCPNSFLISVMLSSPNAFFQGWTIIFFRVFYFHKISISLFFDSL